MVKFEKLLFSKTIINTYIEVLKDLYNKSISEKEIINEISNFKKNHKIFIIELGFKFYGLSLFDGTILINNRYYFEEQNIEIMIFIFFSTLLHEYMHSLSRILRENDNFFNDTDEFLKYQRITPKESGEYFDNKIFFEVLPYKKITSLEAAYFLDPNNYVYDSSQEFKNAFVKYRRREHMEAGIHYRGAHGLSQEERCRRLAHIAAYHHGGWDEIPFCNEHEDIHAQLSRGLRGTRRH